jgi:hypothetical protein
MNASDNNFQNLKRLLKLKQHEVPPPGYFNRFSESVIARLQAGEARPETLAEHLHIEAPWLVSLLQLFEARPALLGTCATGMGILLIAGFILVWQPDSPGAQSLLASDGASAAPAVQPLVALSSPALAAPADNTGIVASSNSVTSLQPAMAMFGQQNPLFQNTSFASGR